MCHTVGIKEKKEKEWSRGDLERGGVESKKRNCVLTWLPSPILKSMKKKRTAHTEAPGICAMPSGYATNPSPGPTR